MIVDNIYKLIGNTPMLKLNKLSPKDGADIYIKLEYFNPGGSVKDRIALNMIETAEQNGEISPKYSTLIEPTSGNTGIGIAMVGASKGYKVILVMPETMSIERRKIISLYGAEIILVPGSEGMKGAIKKVDEMLKSDKKYFSLKQFKNLANPQSHIKSTALEIIEDTKGKIDVFIAGVGTGGTFTGVATVLKDRLKNVKTVAVEPEDSPVLSGGVSGSHKIQGIGAGFIPDVMDTNLIDSVEKVANKDAYDMVRLLGKTEGILLGPSSGAAVAAALKVAKTLKKGTTIVVMAADNGERYLSVFDL